MKKIQTFSTKQFLDNFTRPDPKLKEIIRQDYGRFFIVPVQDLIKVSKVPIPPTRATTHTLIYLTQGIATMKIGYHPVEIHRNECLVVPAGQVFSYDRYEVNKGFICNFDETFLIGKVGSRDLLKDFEFLKVWGNPVIRPDSEHARYLRQSFQRIYTEYVRNGLKNATLIQAHFLSALCDLNALYRPSSSSKSKTAVTLANRFRELLHLHIRSKHLVSDYASLLHVTPNHLNKAVRQITQKTPSKWIDETLVTEAKILLFQTNDPVHQIASDLGIDDQSYFSRLFRKYEGLTPLQYRKMIEMS